MSPYDRPILAALRFTLEVFAVLVILTGVGLVGFLSATIVLAAFGTPGDKRLVLVPVPGPVRAMVEFVVFVGAIDSVGAVFGVEWALAVFGVLALYAYLARERLLWLLRGAPQ